MSIDFPFTSLSESYDDFKKKAGVINAFEKEQLDSMSKDDLRFLTSIVSTIDIREKSTFYAGAVAFAKLFIKDPHNVLRVFDELERYVDSFIKETPTPTPPSPSDSKSTDSKSSDNPTPKPIPNYPSLIVQFKDFPMN